MLPELMYTPILVVGPCSHETGVAETTHVKSKNLEESLEPLLEAQVRVYAAGVRTVQRPEGRESMHAWQTTLTDDASLTILAPFGRTVTSVGGTTVGGE